MIKIQSTPAKIGLNTTNSELTINQQKAEVSIEQPKAKLNISITPSRLTIDQSKAWSDMNLKSVFELSRDFAEQGFQDSFEGIARIAQQGDQLMRIENKGNPIAEQAKLNSQSKVFEFNYGTLPKSPFRVKLDYKPAQVNIDWEINQPIIEAKTYSPAFSYQPGGVEVYLRQQASLSITYESQIDQKG